MKNLFHHQVIVPLLFVFALSSGCGTYRKTESQILKNPYNVLVDPNIGPTHFVGPPLPPENCEDADDGLHDFDVREISRMSDAELVNFWDGLKDKIDESYSTLEQTIEEYRRGTKDYEDVEKAQENCWNLQLSLVLVEEDLNKRFKDAPTISDDELSPEMNRDTIQSKATTSDIAPKIIHHQP